MSSALSTATGLEEMAYGPLSRSQRVTTPQRKRIHGRKTRSISVLNRAISKIIDKAKSLVSRVLQDLIKALVQYEMNNFDFTILIILYLN